MAINYGLLQPQSTPKGGVIAQAPAAPSPGQGSNPLNELAGGLMSGLQQGQQMQNNQLAIERNKIGLEADKIGLQEAQQKQQDAASMRAAYAQGEQATIQAGNKLFGPEFEYKYRTTVANYDKALAEVAEIRANNKIKQPAVLQAYQMSLAQIGVAADQAEVQKPGSGAKVFELMFNQLDPIDQKVLQKQGLGQYDPAVTATMKLTGLKSLADAKEAEEAKSLSNEGKDARQLAKLQTTENLTPEQEAERKILEQNTTGKGNNYAFTNENQLRTQWLNQSKPFKDVSDAYGRINASAKDPSPAGDLALIFNYMKMLDPGSTVREGEFANAQNSGSVPEIIRARYNKVINGQRLDKDQRNDFVSRAGKLYQSQKKSYDTEMTKFRGIAERSGLNPENAVPDMSVQERTDVSNTGQTYSLNGQPFDMERAMKETGLSREEIIKQAGLK